MSDQLRDFMGGDKVNWDTEEMLDWLINDEILYRACCSAARSEPGYAHIIVMIGESAIENNEYLNVDPDQIDWSVIGKFFIEEVTK